MHDTEFLPDLEFLINTIQHFTELNLKLHFIKMGSMMDKPHSECAKLMSHYQITTNINNDIYSIVKIN